MIRPVTDIDNVVPVRTAVISVFQKDGLDVLVRGLLASCPDIMIFSSGGTFSFIQNLIGEEEATKHLQEVSKYTGMPETTGGLVKTLHHKLFLGYLTETYCADHQQDLRRENAVPIDLLVIGLYPFQEVVSQPETTIEVARGNIDVGGPSALRAAAKNWHRVATLANPTKGDYEEFVRYLQENNGCTTSSMRFAAWKKTFLALSDYDRNVYQYLESVKFEDAQAIYNIH